MTTTPTSFYSRLSRRLANTALLGLALLSSATAFGQLADAPTPIQAPATRDMLFAPAADVTALVKHQAGGIAAKQDSDGRFTIAGKLAGNAGSVVLAPPDGTWDFSAFSLFSIRLTNDGPGTVWIQVRLDNNGAQDWANSALSQTYLLPGETGSVTVGYPRSWDKDDSPEAFEPAAAKPNGWRSHWKQFNPADVKACRIVIRSSDPDIQLTGVHPYLAWPFGSDYNAKLVALPHIDRYGQAIPFDWPTKIKSNEDLIRQRNEEASRLAGDAGPAAFDAFGGYANGPQRQATGYFRTEKFDGKWWIIDPQGRLFWSNGVCTVGNRCFTPINAQRKELFAELPEKDTPDYAIGFNKRKDGPYFDFLHLNSQRKYGEDWQTKVDDITHRRLRAWGMNTLGAWSDKTLMDDDRTPYTEILHIWSGPRAIDDTADPFEPGFEARYREAIGQLAKTRKEDPWMLGVFINNEIHWHNDMIEKVLAAGQEQPAYRRFVEVLKAKYDSIDALGKAWGSDATDWDSLKPGKTDAWREDRDALYALMAERYYRVCKELMAELLPNHLYLGSRVHTAPAVVIRAMCQHVDVYSTNHYAPLASSVPVPDEIDVPVMISEFHFGTIDRGVTGMSLCPVDGQVARERSFAAYLVAGLMDPRVVGAHWFAYTDQPATGKPNENYQIGLIDTTDTPYDGFVAMSRAIGENMYKIRLKKDAQLLEEVGKLIQSTR